MPIRPAPSTWVFPDVTDAPGDGPVAIGADLEPGTLLEAYSRGLFPMPMGRRRIAWFSPDPRGVLLPNRVHVSRSLRRSMRHFEVRVDTAFAEVVDGCADPRRPHGWIDGSIRAAYQRLHEMGWAHSVEIFLDDRLAGGLYGVGIGGLFAAESKFHRVTDASKAAVVALCRIMAEVDSSIIDVQWATPHLMTLGVVEVPRHDYLRSINDAMMSNGPEVFDRNGASHTISTSPDPQDS